MKKLSKTSVSDLVLSAIFSLQQKNGVSATEITKYICSKRGYKKKDAKELVRKALTRATENGIFTKKGGLYRIDTQSSKEPKLLKKNSKKKTLKSKPMKTNDLQDITNELIQYDVKLKKFDKPKYSKNSGVHVARPLPLTSRFSRSLSKPEGNEEPNEETDSFNKNEDYDDDDDDDDDDDYLEDEEDDSEDDEINFFDDDQDGSRTSDVAVDAGPRCKKPKPKKKPAKGRCRPKPKKRCKRKKKSKRGARDKKKKDKKRKSAKSKSKKSKNKSKDKSRRCPSVRDKTKDKPKPPEEPEKREGETEKKPPPEDGKPPGEDPQKSKTCKNKDGTTKPTNSSKSSASKSSSKPGNNSKPANKEDSKSESKSATKESESKSQSKSQTKEGGVKAKYRRRYVVDAENFQPNSTDNELEIVDVDSGEDLLNFAEDEKFIDEYWDLNIDEDTDENLEKCEHKEGDECCNDNSSENGKESRSPSIQPEEKSHRKRPGYKSADSDDDDKSKSELTKEDDFDPDDSEGSYKSHSNKRKYDYSYEFDRLRAKYPKKKKKTTQ